MLLCAEMSREGTWETANGFIREECDKEETGLGGRLFKKTLYTFLPFSFLFFFLPFSFLPHVICCLKKSNTGQVIQFYTRGHNTFHSSSPAARAVDSVASASKVDSGILASLPSFKVFPGICTLVLSWEDFSVPAVAWHSLPFWGQDKTQKGNMGSLCSPIRLGTQWDGENPSLCSPSSSLGTGMEQLPTNAAWIRGVHWKTS